MLRIKPLEALRALPRDTRDTLFVLLVVAWVLLPHSLQLPLWCGGLTTLILVWRSHLALGGLPLPGRWWLVALLALAVAATALTHKTLLGREAGVMLVVILLALKTLEMRARRDAFVVFFLGFFAVLTQFFSSQSLWTAAYMLVAMLGLLTALVHAHVPGSPAPLRVAAQTAGRLGALGLPLMAVLFVLFPRVAPLWGVGQETPQARSGLSPSVSVGSMADVALDETIALRLRFLDAQPPAGSPLYFRGPVLAQFDGRQWSARDSAPAQAGTAPEGLRTQGVPLRYEVTLEPSAHPWLLVLDATPTAPQAPNLRAKPTADLQWKGDSNAGSLRRYEAQSYLQFQYGPRQWQAELAAYTVLPPGLNPRTRAWAAQLRAQPALAAADTRALSAAVLEHLGSGAYRYTLQPGLYGEHTADEFWFERKAGFCEHIASAYVVVMRALGVPARLVTGYQGAQRNVIDGYWTVRQSDAHAWAEVWQAGLGWLRVDPTAAVSPWRVEEPTRLGAQRGPVNQLLGSVDIGLWSSARAAWEAANNRWNQWILSYGQGTQMEVLKSLGFASPSWEDLAYLLAGVTAAAALVGTLGAVRPHRRRDPWHALLWRAHKRLRGMGLALPPGATPRQMAQHAQDRWGDAALPLGHWLMELERMRYAGPAAAMSAKALKNAWRSLSWPATDRRAQGGRGA